MIIFAFLFILRIFPKKGEGASLGACVAKEEK